MNATRCHIRCGLTLLELVAAITILLILAVIVLPRFGSASASAKSRGCEANRRNLEVQARLWYRTKGSWPATNLSDLGANTSFLPEGLPVCPVDGSAYTLDATTHQVTGHTH
jgi:prepilin-type N-terminal cleavage/methylation domain-containing protein